VGGNFGWFSIFGGILGCRVVSWEPVPIFRAFFEYNIARNKLHHLIELRPSVVVQYPSVPGEANYTVVVPQRGFWGTASIGGANIDESIDNEGDYKKVNVTGESLDQVLGPRNQRITLLKADVEGFEPGVVAGAQRLLQEERVDNMVMEYSPAVWEKNNLSSVHIGPEMLLQLHHLNFSIGHIQHKEGLPDHSLRSWSEPLAQLQEVTRKNIMFDLWDAKQISQNLMWFKPPCEEMLSLHLINDGIPERCHPKSFRSVIAINTNIWASRDPAFKPYLQGPPVGVFPSKRKLSDSWFVPEWQDQGQGGRNCKSLREAAEAKKMSERERAALLISHRCRCGPDQPCQKEEEIADACAQSRRTPFDEEPVDVLQQR